MSKESLPIRAEAYSMYIEHESVTMTLHMCLDRQENAELDGGFGLERS